MLSINKIVSNRTNSWPAALLLFLFLIVCQGMTVLADDCDNWGLVVHVGRQADDDLCTLRAGLNGHATRQLGDKRDFDYFLFYVGYDPETPVNERYSVTLTETRLTRPKISVGTFYDDAPLGNDETGSEYWYNEHSASLGGMTLDEFQKMVTLAPNLHHDGVYDYVNGEIVVIQESSVAETSQLFYAVPVGTNLGTNTQGEYSATFTPPDRGAYIIMISNYNPTNRRGRLTGSYKISVSHD